MTKTSKEYIIHSYFYLKSKNKSKRKEEKMKKLRLIATILQIAFYVTAIVKLFTS